MFNQCYNCKIHDETSNPLKTKIPPHETEVFRMTKFSKDKCYHFALYSKKIGKWPDDKYYANTELLEYLGYWVNSERWGGCGDGSGGAENFNNNGKINRIVYDYDGKTCFVEALATHSLDSEPKSDKI